jgi:two-component system response regulator FixJ
MTGKPTVCIVDDDADVRDSLAILLRRSEYDILTFDSARAFLARGIGAKSACVLADIRMPEMDGLTLQREINRTIPGLPVIIMSGHGDVAMAVQAMKEGAIDFLEKPFEKAALLDALKHAFSSRRAPPPKADETAEPPLRKPLTEREREVFDLLVQGHQNKVVAHKLGISTRTAEAHRARVMDKLDAKNLADLVRHSLSRRSR